MIFCVVPPELADELFDRLVDYYKDNPNVQVIVDRRDGSKPAPANSKQSKSANRRRSRIPGTFPEIEAH